MRIEVDLWRAVAVAVVLAALAAGDACASLARNAAGAKNIGDQGRLVMDTAAQFEVDGDGAQGMLEAGFQFQLTRRFQLLVEGTPLEARRPNEGPPVRGFGDTEVTGSLLLIPASGMRLSLVVGAKVKVPTASRRAIGTGKADASALLVLGRESGELELSLEAEYATFGQPGGEHLRDQFLFTLTGEYGVNDWVAVYTEVFGNSAPSRLEGGTVASRLGIEFDVPFREWAAPYLGFEADTEALVGARAGVEWTW